MFVGSQQHHVEEPYTTIATIATIYYFSYFIIIIPIVGIIENTLIDIALDNKLWTWNEKKNKPLLLCIGCIIIIIIITTLFYYYR